MIKIGSPKILVLTKTVRALLSNMMIYFLFNLSISKEVESKHILAVKIYIVWNLIIDCHMKLEYYLKMVLLLYVLKLIQIFSTKFIILLLEKPIKILSISKVFKKLSESILINIDFGNFNVKAWHICKGGDIVKIAIMHVVHAILAMDIV